jgi:hypothetical protein
MVASIHIADVPLRTALRLLKSPPTPDGTDGLLHANIAAAVPLRRGAIPGVPQLRRVALIGYWADEAALEAFIDKDPAAEALADGWSARLHPLRKFGTWPGLSDDIPASRSTDYTGPSVVLTLGRVRIPRVINFLRVSAKAEQQAVVSDGLVWGTALARPPFVATCSIWESTKALSTYAYGRSHPEHSHAIDADAKNPFHHQSAFVRFRPTHSAGSLQGKNPLAGFTP